nr:unnamed protein product [Digitaria exilis]
MAASSLLELLHGRAEEACAASGTAELTCRAASDSWGCTRLRLWARNTSDGGAWPLQRQIWRLARGAER